MYQTRDTKCYNISHIDTIHNTVCGRKTFPANTCTSINLLEKFDLDFVSKHVGSDTIKGKSGSRKFTIQMDDAIQRVSFLTRYLSATYNNIGKNIC